MKVFAIGDVHLSFSTNKPMDIFGENWVDYENKIKENWLDKVDSNDVVLIPGDISWAINLDEVKVDLEWLIALPGRKILLKGNHDFWWPSMAKLNTLFPELDFLYNNYHQIGEIAICGSRGWLCPTETGFSNEDMKIYKRELQRIENSIKGATKDGFKRIIVMMHYPPTNDLKERSEFMELFEKYGVEKVVYGHLHTKASFYASIIGMVNGVEYILASSDYLNFIPTEILHI